MGGFSSQVQPNQSSAPAGKNAGLSSMQLGMDPIEDSPQDQLLKTQQLQAEQPSFPQGNQFQPNMENGSQSRGLMQNTGTGQSQGLSGYSPMLEDGPMGSPQGKSGGQGKITFPSQGGQPQLGMPNAYSNTMQPWDNQPQMQQGGGGKGFSNIARQMSKPTGKGA